MSKSIENNKKKVPKISRILLLTTRGISFRNRHLLQDFKILIPQHVTEPKLERWKTYAIINEIAETKKCEYAVLFEGRRKKDLYMWFSAVPNGPSIKFLVESLNTMKELKLIGNCLQASRPLLSFDRTFDEKPHLKVMKQIIINIFNVPKFDPKSQPFVDRVYTFTFLDDRIWFRHFQILSEDGGLNEIGPRFVLNPVKIFNNSFCGSTIWENKEFISPSMQRNLARGRKLK